MAHEVIIVCCPNKNLKKCKMQVLMDEGLIMKPMSEDSFEMDVCVDSDFLGLCGKEERADPDNIKSHEGHVILLNKCPIIWSSISSLLLVLAFHRQAHTWSKQSLII